jgi:uncharacterized protein YqgC (DUF456 family)
MIDILVTIGLGLVMLLGLMGVLIPLFPDIVLIWGASLGYGLLIGWGEKGLWFFGFISLMGIAGVLADVWVSGIGAKWGGASIIAVLGGFLFGGIGLLVAGPIGAVIGLLLGTFIIEFLRLREAKRAAGAMIGAGLGCGISLGVKLLLALTMIVLWIIWVVVG